MDNNEIENLKNLLEVQGSNGNWNYDPYMHGLYNRMEFFLSIIEKREPQFRDAPETWLRYKPLDPN